MKKLMTGRYFRGILYALYLLLFLEAVSRFVLLSDKTYTLLTGDRDSSSWRIRWLKRHEDIKVKIFYRFDQHSPSRGWALKPLIRDMTVFADKIKTGRKHLNTNLKGIRGIAEYPYERIPGKKRILVIGDSFTFGDGVSDEETYSSYLERLLGNAEVINMGVHGYGHDQMLIYLKEEGVKYSPDVVILGFIDDDMTRNLFYFRDFAKPVYALKNGGLRLTHSPVESPEHYLENEFFRLKLLDVFHIIKQGLLWKTGYNDDLKNKLTDAILDEFVATVKSIGAEPLFVYLPTPLDIMSPLQFARGELYFDNYCSSRKITSLSLRNYFKRMAKQYGFPTHGHWDPKEHYRAAEMIKNMLEESKLLSFRAE